MTTKLSLANLDAIKATAAIPAYDRSALTAGIVHFGVGNFHRAHQAIYLDDLFNTGSDHDWAIVGAGVLPSDEAMRAKLEAQDFLTTVVEQDNNKSAARVTAPMIDYLRPGNAAATIAQLADPAIRIVSLTITEGGYFLDPASGMFNPQHPAIAADGNNPGDPKTVFGLIIAGLKARKDKGIMPFTVMSCDNIPGNGEVTHAAVSGLARLPIRRLPNGSRPMLHFRTAWSIASHRQPARAKSASSPMTMVSTTIGRSFARSSSNGCWRIIFPPAVPRSKRSASSSCRMSHPTSI